MGGGRNIEPTNTDAWWEKPQMDANGREIQSLSKDRTVSRLTFDARLRCLAVRFIRVHSRFNCVGRCRQNVAECGCCVCGCADVREQKSIFLREAEARCLLPVRYCPGGGIGRHAGLRSLCLTASRFESAPGHHFRE